MRTLLITYKDGKTIKISNVVEWIAKELRMYYRVDEVAFIGRIPWRTWPLENIASIKEVISENDLHRYYEDHL